MILPSWKSVCFFTIFFRITKSSPTFSLSLQKSNDPNLIFTTIPSLYYHPRYATPNSSVSIKFPAFHRRGDHREPATVRRSNKGSLII
ncbi:hypothetical protein L6164_017790 [Bauhinia variegata]|uniref:Uncharacterized protein n=1 Tax=Bauhinia variegata TaxID=167791 RepID=A0ACB9N904_BAUVA|nr:hypothetical protein L6164_017790 [Bauhinia variegata]